jgi:hypothetical protein
MTDVVDALPGTEWGRQVRRYAACSTIGSLRKELCRETVGILAKEVKAVTTNS